MSAGIWDENDWEMTDLVSELNVITTPKSYSAYINSLPEITNQCTFSNKIKLNGLHINKDDSYLYVRGYALCDSIINNTDDLIVLPSEYKITSSGVSFNNYCPQQFNPYSTYGWRLDYSVPAYIEQTTNSNRFHIAAFNMNGNLNYKYGINAASPFQFEYELVTQ